MALLARDVAGGVENDQITAGEQRQQAERRQQPESGGRTVERLRHMARLILLCCSAHRTFCPIPSRGAVAQGDDHAGPTPLFPTRAPMCQGASSRTRRTMAV